MKETQQEEFVVSHALYSGEHRFILLDTGPKISAVGIEEQQNNVDDPPSLIVQDFTLTKPTDDLPFSYDEMNPIALEIYKGDRLSVLEQCHKTRKICIWVKHWLMLTSWTKLVVVDIPDYVPSLARVPGFSKQDTSRIRWRKRRFN
ncbi:hypothetical protein HID58_093287 [Brassica napus]|uniref:F-box associated beta-propeller type 1 domain-containing protein n=1 Tax=Brassica napus TaxID=3708 RepID=A0ABQ7XEA3_BRANA|nr:hypothetical protein HID58_093287 [Brassica napus]